MMASVSEYGEIMNKKWPDTDGRYYADRVLAVGRVDGEKVFADHGYLERRAGETVVPEGTTISFYVSTVRGCPD